MTAKVTISPHVLKQEVDGFTVLLNSQDNSYFLLDEIGNDIWDTLVQTKDVDNTRDMLLSLYDVDATELEGDLKGFVDTLAERGLIGLE